MKKEGIIDKEEVYVLNGKRIIDILMIILAVFACSLYLYHGKIAVMEEKIAAMEDVVWDEGLYAIIRKVAENG